MEHKRLCISNSSCFFLFVLLLAIFRRTAKGFSGTFYHPLPSKCVTKIRLILLGTLKKVFARIVPYVVIQDVCGTWHVMCFRENNNGGSKRAYTVTAISHLLWNNLIWKDFQISTATVPMATAGRLVSGGITNVTPTFDHVFVWDHVTNENHYISTTVVPITTKPGRTYLERLLVIKSHDRLITSFRKITWQTKIIVSPLPQCLQPLNLTGLWLTLRDP